MKTDAYTVDLMTLQALAVPYGRAPTREWLSKKANQGLLPKHRPPGMGKGKGRGSRYTEALAHQVVPLLQAIELHGKNLGAVGWDLWWKGFYAAPRYWRTPLINAAATFDSIRASVANIEENENKIEELIKKVSVALSSKRTTDPLVGSIKRHAPELLETFIALIVGILNGSYIPFLSTAHDSYDVEQYTKIFAKPLSIPASDAEIENSAMHFPISVEGLDEQFAALVELLNIPIKSFIDGLSDHEIAAGLSELALLLLFCTIVERASQQQYGRSMGLKLFVWLDSSASAQAYLLVGWLLLRRDQAMRDGMAHLSKVVAEQFRIARERACAEVR